TKGWHMTTLLFGLNVSPSAAAGSDPLADAKRAEDLGFDFVSANDHMHGPDPRYETWTMLSWIAARTSRIRVATRVLGVPYRHPRPGPDRAAGGWLDPVHRVRTTGACEGHAGSRSEGRERSGPRSRRHYLCLQPGDPSRREGRPAAVRSVRSA